MSLHGRPLRQQAGLVRAIYRKLGATTRAEAVERAYEAGLLP